MTASLWTIRPARDKDAAELSALAEQTFRDAFTATNTPEDMEIYCAAAYSPSIQADELRDPARDTLVVEQDQRLIAYAQLHWSPPPPCVAGPAPLELKRFYLVQALHGSGVARDLMDAVFTHARALGADPLWLGVWERNPRAQRFYEKSGFTVAGDHVFLMGRDPQRDLVMARRP